MGKGNFRNTLNFMFFCSLLMLIMPLSINLFLPAISAISTSYSTSSHQIQIGLSIFLAGYSISHIFFGYIYDSKGINKPLIVALCLFLLANFLMVLNGHILWLFYVSRFLQGVGASGTTIAAFKMVKANSKTSSTTKMFSYLGTVTTLIPALAPSVGGFLTYYYDWHYCFALLFLIGLLTLISITAFFFKSHGHLIAPEARIKLSKHIILTLFKSPKYVSYVFCGTTTFFILYVFMNVLPTWANTSLHLSSLQEGYILTINNIILAIGSILPSWLSKKLNDYQCSLVGTVVIFVSVLLALIALKLQLNYIAIFFMMLVSAGTGVLYAPTNSGALADFHEISGLASAISLFTRFMLTMIGGSILFKYFGESLYAVIITTILLSIANFVALYAFCKENERKSPYEGTN